jgi:hypothetical protein
VASFTVTHRFAYHVFPLHALKPIWESKALFSKVSATRRVSLMRNTSASVDFALGFEDYVHFYLTRGQEIDFSKLSILRAQLTESKVPAFPHVALVVDTANLEDGKCTVCNFNIAVSRPSYTGVKGGNHARGTSVEKIRSHWRGFRGETPDLKRRRYSEWYDGLEVPVLRESEIVRYPQRVGHGTRSAELLIRERYVLHETDRLYCFSSFDLRSIGLMPGHPHAKAVGPLDFEWYRHQDRVLPEVRRSIELYFSESAGEFPSDLDCDRIRPRK